MTTLIVYLIGGGFAGTLAGLLGIGGGIIIIPLLVWLLPHENVPAEAIMHVAVASSLAIVVGTSLSSIRAHHHYRGVQWSIVRQMLTGLVGGAVLGAFVADYLSSDILQVIFGSFLLFIAYRMFFTVPILSESRLPSRLALLGMGSFSGALATMVGIGGGTILVPFFNRCGLEMRKAVATSAVCTFPISLTAVISYMLVGTDQGGLPAYTTGYVYWIPVIGTVIPSVLCAPLGAKLAYKIPALKLRRIFAVFVFLVSLDMLQDAILGLLYFAGK
ncbi:MAG: sulfite exporter TauE/SafE family protein [Gammaproteobacteria bacterium]